jgi:antitoxin (DNA-binding transcriptional repressor) of toxin-antitoxin stability system
MSVATASRAKKPRQPKTKQGRPSVGIRELKAKASAIVEDVKNRRITYAVTKHGAVEALIVPADAGERLLAQPEADSAWDAWDALVARLAKGVGKQTKSALEELEQMRR